MTSLTFTLTPTSSLGGLFDSPLNLTSVYHNITLCLPTLLPQTQHLYPVLRSTWIKKLTGFLTCAVSLTHCRDQYHCTVWAQFYIVLYPGCYYCYIIITICYFCYTFYTLVYTFPSWYSLMWKKQLSNLCLCNRSYLQALKSYSLCIRPGNVVFAGSQ